MVLLLFFVFFYFYLDDLFSGGGNQQAVRVGTQENNTSMSTKYIYLFVGVILLYNLIYNYVMTHRVGPGYPLNINHAILDEYQVNKNCNKCSGRKPIRSHHCSICNKCILQMDRNYNMLYRSLPMAGNLYWSLQSSFLSEISNLFNFNEFIGGDYDYKFWFA